MGFFKRLFSEKEIVVDPADLTLPDVIPTDYPEVILKKLQASNVLTSMWWASHSHPAILQQ